MACNLPLYQLERAEETDTTKREAQAWEHETMLKQGVKLDMTFGSFFEVYEADKKQRVKLVMYENTRADLKTLLSQGEKITPKAWRTEKERLEKEMPTSICPKDR